MNEYSPDPSGAEISVIVPAFNEGMSLGGVLEDLKKILPDCSLIVVDDGSTDDTYAKASGFDCTVIRHPTNRGYGASWKSGMSAVNTPYVGFFDADGQMRSQDLVTAYRKCRLGDCDLVSGKRDRSSHAPFIRRPGKVILHKLANYIAKQPLPDPNCGLRIFKTDVLRRYLPLLPDGYSASLTSLLLFIHRGYTFAFVDIVVARRVGSSSARQIRDGSATLITMVRIIALFDPLRIFLPSAIFLIVVGGGYSLYEALAYRLGVPILGALLVLVGFVCFLLGIICDQISAMRIERFESLSNRGIQSRGPHSTIVTSN
jgi:glycosyltransferase involved in cell wall biosynthesis